MQRIDQYHDAIGEGEFLISADYLELLIAFSAKFGVPPDFLFSGTDISLEDYLSRPSFVRSDTYNRLIDKLINESRDPFLPWRFGRAVSELPHGAVGLALQSCTTLKQFFELLPTFIATRAGYALSVSPLLTTNRCELVLRSSRPGAPDHIVWFNTISSLMAFAWMSRRLTSTEDAHLEEELALRWPSPKEVIPEELLPKGMVTMFNQPENLIAMPKTRLHARIVSGSPKLMNAALQRCEIEVASPPQTADAVEKVRWVFRKADPEFPTLEEVASYLGMSPATLKRHLKASETSFINIKNKVRFDRVTGLLMLSDLSIDRIAIRVGFSDASNLSKAFRQYFGVTPGEYRRQNGYGKP